MFNFTTGGIVVIELFELIGRKLGYDMCLDGVIVQLEKKRRSKNNYKKAVRECETWHCPQDCNDFKEY